MSRIGKIPIKIPKGVTVTLEPEQVKVKGPKGQLGTHVPGHIVVKQQDGTLLVERPDDDKQSRAFHGLVHRLITSMITGVTEGFSKQLEIQGVGYRAQAQGKQIELQLGFSHPVIYKAPEGITIETPTQTSITVSGIDKQQVGQVAAELRAYRPPEPYKGKGVRYADEHVRRKVGKTGAK